MSNLILSCQQLTKSFSQADGGRLQIFHGINLELAYGESISIIGSSGSGKTSLLQILAGLDHPSSGQVIVCGKNLQQLESKATCQLRNSQLGFVYQFHHLLPEFTALENTLMPLIIGGEISHEQRDYANYLLERLGLAARSHHYPNQLSGGERQRVAIARAVVNNPKIIFADEPTGNLDNATAHQVLDIFLDLQQELKTSLIIVSHDLDIASRTDKQYRLHDGYLTLIPAPGVVS